MFCTLAIIWIEIPSDLRLIKLFFSLFAPPLLLLLLLLSLLLQFNIYAHTHTHTHRQNNEESAWHGREVEDDDEGAIERAVKAIQTEWQVQSLQFVLCAIILRAKTNIHWIIAETSSPLSLSRSLTSSLSEANEQQLCNFENLSTRKIIERCQKSFVPLIPNACHSTFTSLSLASCTFNPLTSFRNVRSFIYFLGA